MKYLALFICLIGLFSLFFYMKFSLPIEISSENELKYLEDNQKVLVNSEIYGKRVYSENIVFNLKNDLILNCKKPCILDNTSRPQNIVATYNKFYNSLDFVSLDK